ncbi:MAG: penicillin acylase family protein [Leptospiraceae bacterium]|nr:penicillin acylase family protein [Leptospiraceae bacterium]
MTNKRTNQSPKRWQGALRNTAVLLLVLITWVGLRSWLLRADVALTKAMQEQAGRVQILRDNYGVPHIHGQSDADAAFGLAYAHAEDDFAEIQLILAATRGKLGLFRLNGAALGNDFYTGLIRLWPRVAADYDAQLSPSTKDLLEGYAAGLNYYAALHPGAADGRIFPVQGIDLAAGFAHKLPLFMRLHTVVGALSKADRNWSVGDRIPALHSNSGPQTGGSLQVLQWLKSAFPMDIARAADFGAQADATLHLEGSNSHAVGPGRSADGITRLNINSHQPWTGPVAWYEAHVASDDGWNMNGGTFPGAPLILVGHNDQLGWAHTVNKSDALDVYRLTVKRVRAASATGSGLVYKLDDEWLPLGITRVPIEIDLTLFSFTIYKSAFWSRHGPVFQNDFGYFAIRYAGLGRFTRAVEQWYRMSKAHNLAEWQQAMRMQALPMFNTVYADRYNIYYVYNALLPQRQAGLDWQAVMDGSRSDLIWQKYLDFDQLPQVTNPPSGFIQNCNSSPFVTTTGYGNPDPRRYQPEQGIEMRITNRAMRSHELFGRDRSITHDEFVSYKWDRKYARGAPIYKEAIDPVLQHFQPRTEAEKKGLALLANWDGNTDPDSRAAALAILTWRPIWKAIVLDHAHELPDPLASFRSAVEWLSDHYGRVDVPLGTVQRLRRGDLDLGLGGGPDVLNAIHGELEGSHLVGTAGDSYISIVAFHPDGPRAWSLHQFGNSDVADSPHFADQAPLFATRQLRRTLRSAAEVRALGAGHYREYRPGTEITP